MAQGQTAFIWYELMTPDADAAGAFYGSVVGWTFGERAPPEQAGPMDYRMIHRSDGSIAGGVLALSQEMVSGGAHPGWMGYLQSDDVDASVAAIIAEGGQVHMPAVDLPVGRIAMVTDPQGAHIYVMKPIPPEGSDGMENSAFDPEKAQHVRWNELMSSDPDASIAFYNKHFGIRQDGDMDMGDMGKYSFIHHNSVAIGAIMPLMPQMPISVWSYYIGVDDIDRSIAAISDSGGQIVSGPMEIPGGEYALNGIDPQGAAFGLVGPRKS